MRGKIPDGHIVIGNVVGTHGLRGTLKVAPLTDFPQRFAPGAFIFIGGKEYEVSHLAWHKSQMRVTVKTVTSIEQGEALRGLSVTVSEESPVEMEADEYFTDELIGLDAIDQYGTLLGQITDVFPTPAHDVIVVDDALIPAVQEFVQEVDLESGKVHLILIPGMWPKGKEPQ